MSEMEMLGPFDIKRMGPLPATHPILDTQCPACDRVFTAGDYVTLVPLGPGADEEARAKARAGRPYNSAAACVHWACATGQEDAGPTATSPRLTGRPRAID